MIRRNEPEITCIVPEIEAKATLRQQRRGRARHYLVRPLNHTVSRPSRTARARPEPLEALVRNEVVHHIARIAPRRCGPRIDVALKRDRVAHAVTPLLHDVRAHRPKMPLQPPERFENSLRSLALRMVQESVAGRTAHKRHRVTITHSIPPSLGRRLVHVKLEERQHHRRHRPWRRSRRPGHRLREAARVAF